MMQYMGDMPHTLIPLFTLKAIKLSISPTMHYIIKTYRQKAWDDGVAPSGYTLFSLHVSVCHIQGINWPWPKAHMFPTCNFAKSSQIILPPPQKKEKNKTDRPCPQDYRLQTQTIYWTGNSHFASNFRVRPYLNLTWNPIDWPGSRLYHGPQPTSKNFFLSKFLSGPDHIYLVRTT